MSIVDNFISVRDYSEVLCAPLKAEDYVVQIATFASPAKWHLGHTSWFFEEFILKNYVNSYTEFDKNFNFIFNSYYNSAGKRVSRANRGNLSRPTVEEVYAYRRYVNNAIKDFLSQNPDNNTLNLVTLGLNHEQQHQELLLTDIKYMFANNPLLPKYNENIALVNDENKTSGFVSIKEGVYQIGYQENDFCYDNELGVHKVYLNSFEISKALVTNGEFIEFIEIGGYKDFDLWLEEALHWIDKNNIHAPLYWHKIDGQWHHYTLAGLREVNPNAILTHVSFYEAAAFAEWKGMRLPTEFEWETASEKLQWGQRWEWTNSAYLPYPNFKKPKGAIGEYNGKFMDKQKVLRGASAATSKNHSRNTYRNFFYSQERWQFTGIRLAK